MYRSDRRRPRDLRWYEHWLLSFLVRSPRIYRIVVQLEAFEEVDDEALDDPPEGELPAPASDYVPYLEHLYQASEDMPGP